MLHLAFLPSADAAGAAERYPAGLQSCCFCCAWLEANYPTVHGGPNHPSYLIRMWYTVVTHDTFENGLLSQQNHQACPPDWHALCRTNP